MRTLFFPVACLGSAVVIPLCVEPVEASIVWYKDKGLWEAAAGATTTIDFVSALPPMGIYEDEYISQGLILDYKVPVQQPAQWWRFDETSGGAGAMLHDGGGLADANGIQLAFRFTQPVNAFASVGLSAFTPVDWYSFYLNGTWVGSMYRPNGQNGSEDPFDGVVTDFYFDRVITTAWYVDDVYFSTIPAPAALPIIGIGAVIFPRRRR
jgi:hypothetical protein